MTESKTTTTIHLGLSDLVGKNKSIPLGEVPDVPANSIPYVGSNNTTVFDIGNERWRFRGRKLISYLKYKNRIATDDFYEAGRNIICYYAE